MNADRRNAAREKLEAALKGVEIEITKCVSGQSSISSEKELKFIATEIREMLDSIAIERKIVSPGLWRIMTDTWPHTNKLRQQIVAAEYAYDRLRS